MAKRRSNGEGNIRKRKDGRWEGRYTVGHDPATGKQVFKNVLGKTQAEVKEKLKKALLDAGKLDFTKTGQYTVGSWMDTWFENVCKIKVRPSSHQTYKGYIENHIKPNIGNIPLEKLTTMDLQKFYRKLLTEGRVERIEAEHQPKGLSAKTVRNINQVISSAMDLAVAQKIILENPTNACELPKVEHKEMQTVPAEQLQAFLEEAKRSGVYEMYYIELSTGLRRGELLGLKWQDIDWKNGIIKVRRQVARSDGKIVEAPLKTKNSYRTVSISPQAVEVLKQQKAKTNDTYVFPSPNGGPISPDSVNNMLKRVLERAGIPKVRFHDLRHTFATIALQRTALILKPSPACWATSPLDSLWIPMPMSPRLCRKKRPRQLAMFLLYSLVCNLHSRSHRFVERWSQSDKKPILIRFIFCTSLIFFGIPFWTSRMSLSLYYPNPPYLTEDLIFRMIPRGLLPPRFPKFLK